SANPSTSNPHATFDTVAGAKAVTASIGPPSYLTRNDWPQSHRGTETEPPGERDVIHPIRRRRWASSAGPPSNRQLRGSVALWLSFLVALAYRRDHVLVVPRRDSVL